MFRLMVKARTLVYELSQPSGVLFFWQILSWLVACETYAMAGDGIAEMGGWVLV